MKKGLTNGIGLKKKDRDGQVAVRSRELGQLGVKTPETVMLTMEDLRREYKSRGNEGNYDEENINYKFLDAVYMGDKGYNVAKSLLKKGADVECSTSDMDGFYHPIFGILEESKYARIPNVHMLELLLKNGANGHVNYDNLLDADDNPNDTLADYAYKLNLGEHVKLFKKYGFMIREKVEKKNNRAKKMTEDKIRTDMKHMEDLYFKELRFFRYIPCAEKDTHDSLCNFYTTEIVRFYKILEEKEKLRKISTQLLKALSVAIEFGLACLPLGNGRYIWEFNKKDGSMSTILILENKNVKIFLTEYDWCIKDYYKMIEYAADLLEPHAYINGGSMVVRNARKALELLPPIDDQLRHLISTTPPSEYGIIYKALEAAAKTTTKTRKRSRNGNEEDNDEEGSPARRAKVDPSSE